MGSSPMGQKLRYIRRKKVSIFVLVEKEEKVSIFCPTSEIKSAVHLSANC
jgi:hypothetical protein